MSWDYEIEAGALRELRDRGPSVAKEIFAFLDKRVKGATDPTVFGKPLRGDLHGYWRYRVRDYRLLCRLANGRLVVVVVKVGHRSDVYDG